MKAPEKIYIFENPISNESDDIWLSSRNFKKDIEYIRKDVFIEKALKWYCLDCECNDSCKADHKCFFKQEYKCYLEGNENAIPPKFENAINPDGSTTENYRYRHFIRRMQDAFIEKACEWLKENYKSYIIVDIDNKYDGIDGLFLEDFKKYMKKE